MKTFIKNRQKRELKARSRRATKEGRHEEVLYYYKEFIALCNNKQSITSLKRLLALYRQLKDYEKELEVINMYFEDDKLHKSEYSDKFFEERLEAVNRLINKS